MPISAIGGATNYAAIPNSAGKQQAATAPASPNGSAASTIVTLSNGQTSSVTESTGTLKSMPLTAAWAVQAFVQADGNENKTLTADEFADQLKRAGVAVEDAKKLFASFDTSEDGAISIDEYAKGVKQELADGGSVFTDVINSYTRDASGKFDERATDDFLRKGLAAANQYARISGERR